MWISFQFLLGFLRKFDKEEPSSPSSFSHLDVTGTYFSVAVVWLAVAIVGWVVYATRRRTS
jgi:hypothetical protein